MDTITLHPPSTITDTIIDIPGSKSLTNRALIMAALTSHSVTIHNPLISDDTEAMISCLQGLGIQINRTLGNIDVMNSFEDVISGTYDLDARLSGTTIRFILALSCMVPGIKTVHGRGRLNERPIKDLVDALREMGAVIEYTEKLGFPPLLVSSEKLQSTPVHMSGAVSSQYFSALLMIAPLIGGITIEVLGEQISQSYIDVTIDMMREWGVSVVNQEYKNYIVPEGTYQMSKYLVEGDYSAAGYFAGIATLTHSQVTLRNIKKNSHQGDKEFLHILEQMGSVVDYFDDSIRVKGNGVKPIDVNMERCPDQAQTLAVLSAFAEGTTRITGVRSLRVKETERVQAVQQELAKMGIRTESPDEDTLIIFGGTPKPATIKTYGDHRMAMSFAQAGARIPGMCIQNPEVVDKTFPEFWEKVRSLGISNSKP